MTISNNIKEFCNYFIDNYKKYYSETIGLTLILTILCYLISGILIYFNKVDDLQAGKQISMLSYFLYRYSKAETYSIVDFIKTIYLFFVSSFSIYFIRNLQTESQSSGSKNKIMLKDISILLLILILLCLFDFTLMKGLYITMQHIHTESINKYLRNIVFHTRIYLPLFIFSLTIYKLTTKDKYKITIKTIIIIYLSLWLTNEIVYEGLLWCRTLVIELILMPVENPEKIYLFETIISIPLIASCFLAYYSAMTYFKNSLKKL